MDKPQDKQDKKPQKTAQARAGQERLAKALKANLARRKASHSAKK